MTVAELWERAELNDEARGLAAPGMPVRAYIEQLARTGHAADAVSSLAQMLPKREAIAWGLECIRRVPAATAKCNAAPAIDAVADWLKDPTEERRRTARQSAERAGVGSPAGCLAMAVFLSGGSMAPVEAQVAPEPAPHLCARLAAGSMALAAAVDPRNAVEHLRSFLDRGFQFAAEHKIWEDK